MCGWHLHAFSTWEVSLSNLKVSFDLWWWHTPQKDEITTSLNDLSHEYSIKSICQVSFVTTKLLAYWESFGTFLAPARPSIFWDVCALPVRMGSSPLPALLPPFVPIGQPLDLSASSREMVHQAICNLCNNWKAIHGTWPISSSRTGTWCLYP